MINMQISSRFTIAIHIITCIETFKDEYKTTSDFLAASVNVNPVIIRRILQQLKKAGIVETKRGSGGAYAAKPLDEITFYDIYKAVDCVENDLFHFNLCFQVIKANAVAKNLKIMQHIGLTGVGCIQF